MTTHVATTPPAPTRSGPCAVITVPAAAAFAFTATWLAGLAVWPTNPSVNSSAAKVVSAYAGHQAIAATQYLLVEGLAAIALAVVLIALGRAAAPRGADRLGHVTVLAGIGAVTVSLVECVLGLWLATAAVPAGDTGRAGTLFNLINRLDGTKMLAFAMMAIAGVALTHRDGPLPRWLGYTAALLAMAMTVSGIGYLLLNNTLATAAAASLPLLLIWVGGTGLALGRRHSSSAPACRPTDAAIPHSPPGVTGAVDRRDPAGVWSGQILDDGRIVTHKRPRGRPRTNSIPPRSHRVLTADVSEPHSSGRAGSLCWSVAIANSTRPIRQTTESVRTSTRSSPNGWSPDTTGPTQDVTGAEQDEALRRQTDSATPPARSRNSSEPPNAASGRRAAAEGGSRN